MIGYLFILEMTINMLDDVQQQVSLIRSNSGASWEPECVLTVQTLKSLHVSSGRSLQTLKESELSLDPSESGLDLPGHSGSG